MWWKIWGYQLKWQPPCRVSHIDAVMYMYVMGVLPGASQHPLNITDCLGWWWKKRLHFPNTMYHGHGDNGSIGHRIVIFSGTPVIFIVWRFEPRLPQLVSHSQVYTICGHFLNYCVIQPTMPCQLEKKGNKYFSLFKSHLKRLKSYFRSITTKVKYSFSWHKWLSEEWGEEKEKLCLTMREMFSYFTARFHWITNG